MTPHLKPEIAPAPVAGRLPWRTLLALSGVASAAGLGVLAYAAFYEPGDIELEQLTLTVPNTMGRLPKDGLRILHLSDSHFQDRDWRENPKIERVRRLTAGLEFDLLIHTGDFIHRDHGLRNILRLLDAVPKPRLGQYGVMGNHDYVHYAMEQALPRMWRTFWQTQRTQPGNRWAAFANWPLQLLHFIAYVRRTPLDGPPIGDNDIGALTAALSARGLQILHNQAVRLFEPDRGLDLWLAGVDDLGQGRPHLGNTLANLPTTEPVLLLSHNPDILASPQIGRVDVVLAGHTHGGQIVLPLWGPAHTQSMHLTRAEVAGYLHRGRTQVYISRGLGEGIPLRFRCRPQIALITLLPG